MRVQEPKDIKLSTPLQTTKIVPQTALRIFFTATLFWTLSTNYTDRKRISMRTIAGA
jgi:hypothetical protein